MSLKITIETFVKLYENEHVNCLIRKVLEFCKANHRVLLGKGKLMRMYIRGETLSCHRRGRFQERTKLPMRWGLWQIFLLSVTLLLLVCLCVCGDRVLFCSADWRGIYRALPVCLTLLHKVLRVKACTATPSPGDWFLIH